MASFLDTPHPFQVVPPLTGSRVGDYSPENTQTLYENVLSPSADALLAGSHDQGCLEGKEFADRWSCLYAQIRLPLASHTPYLLVTALFDHSMDTDMGASPPYSSQDQIDYAMVWGAHVLELAANLTAGAETMNSVGAETVGEEAGNETRRRESGSERGRGSGRVRVTHIYAPSCYQPETRSLSPAFFSGLGGVNGTTQAQALALFLQQVRRTQVTGPGPNPLATYVTYTDGCTDFDCGAQCHSSPSLSQSQNSKN